MTGKAKALIGADDKAWAAAASRIGPKDAATLALYRQRYVAGVPKRPVAEEAADAAALYRVLAEIGGEKLVGPGKALDPATFYRGAEAGKP
jgi:NitT/TauT family transport system substrate-binding protein